MLAIGYRAHLTPNVPFSLHLPAAFVNRADHISFPAEPRRLGAQKVEAERKRKREAACDLIAAMLEADGEAEEAPVDRRQELLEQAEEARKKQEARWCDMLF